MDSTLMEIDSTQTDISQLVEKCVDFAVAASEAAAVAAAKAVADAAAKAALPPKKTVKDVWPELEKGLGCVYSKSSMSTKEYMRLYSHVYDVCTSTATVDTTKGNGLKPTEKSAGDNGHEEFLGKEFYDNLKDVINNRVRDLLTCASEKHCEDLLRYFSTEWTDFRFCSKVTNGLFSYLNRHWVKRELDECTEDVYEVYPLSLITWRDVLFNELNNFVTKSALGLIEKERNGVCIERKLIAGVTDCYVELGINGRGGADSGLKLYEDKFEKDFIEVSQLYYRKEGQEYVQKISFSEYMKKVERRLREELERCEFYLHNSTAKKLTETLEKELITAHLELFHNEIGDFLENSRDDDLARMFRLCKRVEGGLKALENALEAHIAVQGRNAVDAVAEQAFNDPKLFVHTILTVLKRYKAMVEHSFESHPGFMKAFDKAAATFVNINHVTKKMKGGLNKCPELLARYADSLLRKSSKSPDADEMESLLKDVMIVFKYVEDKDVFQKFYTRMLCKRLLTDSSASEDAEGIMIGMLKQMCGFDYTNKLQRMFTDTTLSSGLTTSFREVCKNDATIELGLDFSVMVLGVASWPTLPMITITLPHKMNIAMNEFFKHYTSKHTGRMLNWVHSQSRGELTSTGFGKKYTFAAWSAQMAVLMLYNDQNEYTLIALAEALAMIKEQLVPVLGTLVKNDLVVSEQITNGEVSNSTPDDCVFKLNMKFASKKIKVDLSKTVMRVEQRKETEAVHQDVDSDRKIVIQAAIVRIMKTRKTSTHSTLIGEILSQLTTRFKPKIPMIKRCIDGLIEKEYLKRAEDAHDTYEYLA